ncbi:MAG: tRNA (adenosine(37)-N6)-dimethylallyltransferase MiaA [Myxococcales bacterium FL481]|nr:MAG: tRNA (adenosine(37)-N6)-dimethylallyltransferase MiaA [Myxococcales bacterium FL481]
MSEPGPLLPRAIALVGPTASGKSALGLQVARRLGLAIWCCDSVQVYRGLDIGSAKPTPEDRAAVPHHLLDLVDPSQTFSAGMYGRLARQRLAQSAGLFVGGTGFYLRAAIWTHSGDDGQDLARDDPQRGAMEAIWQERERGEPGCTHARLVELDPETAASIHPRNFVRAVRAVWLCERHGEPVSAVRRRDPPRRDARVLAVVLDPGVEAVDAAVDARADAMLAAGWVDEVQRLRSAGYDARYEAMRTLGYRQLLDHLEGRISLEEACAAIKLATRRYARRQRTWFRNQALADEIVYISRPESFPYARVEAFMRGESV